MRCLLPESYTIATLYEYARGSARQVRRALTRAGLLPRKGPGLFSRPRPALGLIEAAWEAWR